jgi:hypothetical protein
MVKNKKIKFDTYEKAAEWFDTHDMADYADQLKPVDFHFDFRKNRNWVELEREIAVNLRKLAIKQKIPTRILVNRMLKERLENIL